MMDGYAALTEKEKQTLRLIVRGHDAKSTARHLGLSVHTINERLRDARRKLSVSSSREAARMVLAEEGETPDSLGDRQLGEARPGSTVAAGGPGPAPPRRLAWIIGGVLAVSLILAVVAMNALSPAPSSPVSHPQPLAVEGPIAAEATRTALAWLALVDQGRWDDSWKASGRQFRRANTSAAWARISSAVRPPLGAVVSRKAISEEKVPAPPHGYLIVRFLTTFAHKPNAFETVSLEHEPDGWKVVGYWIA